MLNLDLNFQVAKQKGIHTRWFRLEISSFITHKNHHRACEQTASRAPTPVYVIQEAWGGTLEFAFLGFPGDAAVAPGPHFEKHCFMQFLLTMKICTHTHARTHSATDTHNSSEMMIVSWNWMMAVFGRFFHLGYYIK